MGKKCVVKWKKGRDNKYYAYIKDLGYVIQFSTYKKMRKGIKSTCRLKKMNGVTEGYG